MIDQIGLTNPAQVRYTGRACDQLAWEHRYLPSWISRLPNGNVERVLVLGSKHH